MANASNSTPFGSWAAFWNEYAELASPQIESELVAIGMLLAMVAELKEHPELYREVIGQAAPDAPNVAALIARRLVTLTAYAKALEDFRKAVARVAFQESERG